MRLLSYRERRMLLYVGMPAKDVARVERLSVSEVLELRAGLKERGVIPSPPCLTPAQLTFDGVAALMRGNHPPTGL